MTTPTKQQGNNRPNYPTEIISRTFKKDQECQQWIKTEGPSKHAKFNFKGTYYCKSSPHILKAKGKGKGKKTPSKKGIKDRNIIAEEEEEEEEEEETSTKYRKGYLYCRKYVCDHAGSQRKKKNIKTPPNKRRIRGSKKVGCKAYYNVYYYPDRVEILYCWKHQAHDPLMSDSTTTLSSLSSSSPSIYHTAATVTTNITAATNFTITTTSPPSLLEKSLPKIAPSLTTTPLSPSSTSFLNTAPLKNISPSTTLPLPPTISSTAAAPLQPTTFSYIPTVTSTLISPTSPINTSSSTPRFSLRIYEDLSTYSPPSPTSYTYTYIHTNEPTPHSSLQSNNNNNCNTNDINNNHDLNHASLSFTYPSSESELESAHVHTPHSNADYFLQLQNDLYSIYSPAPFTYTNVTNRLSSARHSLQLENRIRDKQNQLNDIIHQILSKGKGNVNKMEQVLTALDYTLTTVNDITNSLSPPSPMLPSYH